jgi:hypothetical protein
LGRLNSNLLMDDKAYLNSHCRDKSEDFETKASR